MQIAVPLPDRRSLCGWAAAGGDNEAQRTTCDRLGVIRAHRIGAADDPAGCAVRGSALRPDMCVPDAGRAALLRHERGIWRASWRVCRVIVDQVAGGGESADTDGVLAAGHIGPRSSEGASLTGTYALRHQLIPYRRPGRAGTSGGGPRRTMSPPRRPVPASARPAASDASAARASPFSRRPLEAAIVHRPAASGDRTILRCDLTDLRIDHNKRAYQADTCAPCRRGSAERAHTLSRGASASIVVVVSSSRKPPDWCCHSRA